ncbi:MAG TPA: trypsin-like peptidase domain-containing protein [Chloroflexota bacterium]|nr:trypsin-like peptidase domain-containing protein [Chloroflexota bacterium]
MNGSVPCPTCGTANDSQASICRRCGTPLPNASGRTQPIGGRTAIIKPGGSSNPHGPRLVAPKDLDLGSVRPGDTVRAKLRLANNGSGLLTGSARLSPGAPWLRILGGGNIYCATGAVEALDLQATTADLRRGRHSTAIVLDTDGGTASVQVSITLARESLFPAIMAAVIAAVVVLGISGVIFATHGGLPFVAAGPTRTPTPTATAVPSATPSITPTPQPTATVVNTGATATAEARLAAQAQQLVANAYATATAVAANSNATATAVSASVANHSPEATSERIAIEAAVNRFLLMRERALATGDASQLAGVAAGKELTLLVASLQTLSAAGEHYRLHSIDQPIWDSIVLNGPDSAQATLSKHEDELIIRIDTGLADDRDPTYTGKVGTLRNQRFAVTYSIKNINGQWLVVDNTVYESSQPQPTPQPDLLPPAGQGAVTAEGTATPVPTAAPSSNQLSIEQVVNLALPAILRVTGTIAHNQQSTGTGFVIRTSGNFAYVVTNDHVVNGAVNVVLTGQGSGPLPALSVQEDTSDDLAVIEIAQPAQPFPALTWGDSSQAGLGEAVVAIGFALGLQGQPSVSNGIISALGRDVGQRWMYLQHTAPINHGNSGGPLLDLQGNVIGINTLVDENAQSVYFAIPSTKAEKEVNTLIGAMP